MTYEPACLSAPDRSEIPLIDSTAEPQAHRIADVLRAGGAARRTFIIDDIPNIVHAARHDVEIEAIYVTDGSEVSGEMLEVFGDRVPPVSRPAPHVAKSLFGRDKRSRVFALGHAPSRRRLTELDARGGDIVILDGVRLPGNIGAIARTANALGAAGIVLLNSGLVSPVDRRLIRASRGTVFSLPVILAARADVIDYCDSRSLPIVSLAADALEPIEAIRTFSSRIAIVMGSERHGPSPEIEAVAAAKAAIPMTSAVESLNVSVAAGIALYTRRIPSRKN